MAFAALLILCTSRRMLHVGIYIGLRFDNVSKQFLYKGSTSMEEIIIEFLLLLVNYAGYCIVSFVHCDCLNIRKMLVMH
jgi:hypothetical protein